MNSSWLRKIGLAVSLTVVFCLQALLPLTFQNFDVALVKWFFLQSILLIIFLVLIFRFVMSLEPRNDQPSRSSEPLESNDFVDPKYLIGAVVHEIRTPLNKLSLLLNREDGLDKAPQISSTLDELTEVVDHVEEVFRRDNLRKRWLSSVEFTSLINSRIDDPSSVKYIIGDNWLYLDPEKMKLTLSNLIENSLEAYGDSNGTVSVEIQSVGPEWCMYVRDRAGGMDPETARVISSQRDGEQTDSSGMGLGLLIARRIVETHKGRMVVESDPSVGTEITITLPKPQNA